MKEHILTMEVGIQNDIRPLVACGELGSVRFKDRFRFASSSVRERLLSRFAATPLNLCLAPAVAPPPPWTCMKPNPAWSSSVVDLSKLSVGP